MNRLGALIVLVFATSNAFAGNLPNLPNTFSSGNPALASEVNENFEVLRAEVEDNASDVTANTDQLSTSVEDISNLQNSVSTLQAQVNSFEQSIASLETTVSTLTSVIKLIGCSSITRSATFDYSSNNGVHTIGSGQLQFDTDWSKASDTSIYLLSDPANIAGVALVPDTAVINITDVMDASIYDMSSRLRQPAEGQIVVLKNISGNYAVLKIVDIKDNTRADLVDELTFDYCILPYGQTKFSK